ncbi:hypothetical protein GCM10010222_74220 [Streptomyces tanashiensis]|uniref:site-specific integrase n=1 Tax=Streptomyces tanashiensis TaxID=67367 RepID=UPI0019BE1861|nr:site-specific integrase [Streptomyces tanashiensis]GGT21382.1 hypothetical protein GCM10010222_74220 [Streptomyces tanashiensis]
MRVVKERDGGVVRRVRLVDGDGEQVTAACRFLDHLVDRGFSPQTICAYAYDLRGLFAFLAGEGTDWREFRGPDALRLLAFLRRAPSRRPAQRLGLTVVVGGPEAPGSLLAPATVNRILAAVASFHDWAVVAEEYDGDSPMQKRLDPAPCPGAGPASAVHGPREPSAADVPHGDGQAAAAAATPRGMRELSLQKRLGHASPESTKAYTRVSDEAVLADYTRALKSNR